MNNSSHDCFITDRIFAAESGGRGRHFSEILGTSEDEDGEDVDVLRRSGPRSQKPSVILIGQSVFLDTNLIPLYISAKNLLIVF